MNKKNVLESDKRLLRFRTYDEYLDSLVGKSDVCYFRNYWTARKIAEFGYRSSGDMLTKEEFYKKLADVTEALFPSKKPHELSGIGLVFNDPMYEELAARERGNRIGLLATIIFIRYFTKDGHEVSGYIDYAERLLNEDWGPFFSEKKKLKLLGTDLATFNWRNKKSTFNHSCNYWVIFDPVKGLVFRHRHDRKTVYADPSFSGSGQNTLRERIFTKHFDHLILYDHFVKRRS